MNNQCYKSLALALMLALASCVQSGAAQTVSQTPATKRDGTTGADNVKWDSVAALALQPDGKIVVAGFTGNYVRIPSAGGGTTSRLRGDMALARYSVDGSLDTSFGEGGKVVADFAGNDDSVHAIALQPDGKILLVGETGWDNCDYDFALARFNSDGAPDTSFGQGGKVTTDFFGGKDEALAVALQSDGRIVIAGRAANDRMNLALARYTQDGTLDTTFGKSGQVVTPSGLYTFTCSIRLRPDGEILVAGGSTTCCIADSRNAESVTWVTSFALTRYHADGSPDAAFADKGTAVTTWRESAVVAKAMTIQPDGKFILAGDTQSGDFALHRFNEDGRFDDSFGHEGKVTTSRQYLNQPKAIGIFPDGSFVVAGSGSNVMPLARYDKNGKLDLRFGKEGKVISPCCGKGQSGPSSIAIQPDGKIIVGGHSEINGLSDFLLLRYDKDGALDASFGSGGRVFTDFNGITDKASAFGLKRNRKSTSAQKPNCGEEWISKPLGVPMGIPGPPSAGPAKGGGIGPGNGYNTGDAPRADGSVTAVDQRPVLLNTPSPRYTEEARRNKVQGTITLRMLIGADGLVKQVRIIRGLPYGLDDMAIEAAYKMRFKPAMKNGQPVMFWQSAQVSFNL